jgi:hypothetical protein
MKRKLTLSIDEDLIEFAHTQAHVHKQSVSAMFTEYLEAQKAQVKQRKIPPIDDMVGVLQAYSIDDSKEGIRRAYAKKYSR